MDIIWKEFKIILGFEVGGLGSQVWRSGWWMLISTWYHIDMLYRKSAGQRVVHIVMHNYDISLQLRCKSHITDHVNPFPKIFFIYFPSSEWVPRVFHRRKSIEIVKDFHFIMALSCDFHFKFSNIFFRLFFPHIFILNFHLFFHFLFSFFYFHFFIQYSFSFILLSKRCRYMNI